MFTIAIPSPIAIAICFNNELLLPLLITNSMTVAIVALTKALYPLSVDRVGGWLFLCCCFSFRLPFTWSGFADNKLCRFDFQIPLVVVRKLHWLTKQSLVLSGNEFWKSI